jgi:hypothetical protein
MKFIFNFLVAFVFCPLFAVAQPSKKSVSLFNGKNLNGWAGDTLKTWRVQDGTITGGSLIQMVPHNEFISTTRSYTNFILKVKFKLTGTEGFINTGVQFRSQRIDNPPYEMTGYQADLGDGFWGCLYDESRRDRIVAQADTNHIKHLLKRNDWNDYEVRCEGRHITIKLNGGQTVEYTEPDDNIPETGLIAFQIHGGGKAQVFYKDILITELP